MSLGLIAYIRVQVGAEAQFETVFKELQSAVRANEPGCLLYDLFRSQNDPQVYVVMEQYASQEALEAHGKTDHFRASGAKMFPLLDGAPDVQVMGRIS